MKNIFEKEDTEEHFDWGSAPGGRKTEGKKSETQFVKGRRKTEGKKNGKQFVRGSASGGEKNRREEEWKNSSSGAVPAGKKNKITPGMKK